MLTPEEITQISLQVAEILRQGGKKLEDLPEIADADLSAGNLSLAPVLKRTNPPALFRADISKLRGPKGETGATGNQGPKGETGQKGDTGAAGPVGPEGPEGKQGVPGPVGPQGPEGPEGKQGQKGDTGNSFKIVTRFATESALIATYPDGSGIDGVFEIGTGQPFNYYYWDIDAGTYRNMGPIQGVKGDTGSPGAIGPKGEKGDKGDLGQKGDTGETGPVGPPGPKGEPGESWKVNDIDKVPSESDTGYPIGAELRYFDSETGEYVFYKLYNIKDGAADWRILGGSAPVPAEIVRISLSTNQDNGSFLMGKEINISVDGKSQIKTWYGEPIVMSVPGNIVCMVSVTGIEGYKKPDPVAFNTVPGNERTVDLRFETTIVTIGALSVGHGLTTANASVVLSRLSGDTTFAPGELPVSLRIPPGEDYSVRVSGITGGVGVSPIKIENTTSGKAQSIDLNFDFENVKIVTSQGISASDAVTIKDAVTGETLIDAIALTMSMSGCFVAYGIKYEISISSAGFGPVTATASQPARTITFPKT